MIRSRSWHMLFALITSAVCITQSQLKKIDETLTTQCGGSSRKTTKYHLEKASITQIIWNEQSTLFAVVTTNHKSDWTHHGVGLCNKEGTWLTSYPSGEKVIGISFCHDGNGLFIIGVDRIMFWNIQTGEIKPLYTLQENESIECWQLDPHSDALYVSNSLHRLLLITKDGVAHTKRSLRGNTHQFSISQDALFLLEGNEDCEVSDGFVTYNGTFEKLFLTRINLKNDEMETFKLAKRCPASIIKTTPESTHVLVYNPEQVWLIDKNTLITSEIVFYRSAIDLGCIQSPKAPYGYQNAYISCADFLPNGTILVIEQNGNASVFDLAGKELERFYIGSSDTQARCFSFLSEYFSSFGTTYRAAVSKNAGILCYDAKRVIHYT